MLDSLFGSDVLLFSIPALVGTVVFLLKLGLLSLGGVGADADVDVDLDVDAGMDMDHAGDVDDSTHAFQILSIHSIAAFLMGFGWGGLVGFRTFDWNTPSSFALGLAFGAALVWMLAALLQATASSCKYGKVGAHDDGPSPRRRPSATTAAARSSGRWVQDYAYLSRSSRW
jgi:hypothetical protein